MGKGPKATIGAIAIFFLLTLLGACTDRESATAQLSPGFSTFTEVQEKLDSLGIRSVAFAPSHAYLVNGQDPTSSSPPLRLSQADLLDQQGQVTDKLRDTVRIRLVFECITPLTDWTQTNRCSGDRQQCKCGSTALGDLELNVAPGLSAISTDHPAMGTNPGFQPNLGHWHSTSSEVILPGEAKPFLANGGLAYQDKAMGDNGGISYVVDFSALADVALSFLGNEVPKSEKLLAISNLHFLLSISRQRAANGKLNSARVEVLSLYTTAEVERMRAAGKLAEQERTGIDGIEKVEHSGSPCADCQPSTGPASFTPPNFEMFKMKVGGSGDTRNFRGAAPDSGDSCTALQSVINACVFKRGKNATPTTAAVPGIKYCLLPELKNVPGLPNLPETDPFDCDDFASAFEGCVSAHGKADSVREARFHCIGADAGHVINVVRFPLVDGQYRYCAIEPQTIKVDGFTCPSPTVGNGVEGCWVGGANDWAVSHLSQALCARDGKDKGMNGEIILSGHTSCEHDEAWFAFGKVRWFVTEIAGVPDYWCGTTEGQARLPSSCRCAAKEPFTYKVDIGRDANHAKSVSSIPGTCGASPVANAGPGYAAYPPPDENCKTLWGEKQPALLCDDSIYASKSFDDDVYSNCGGTVTDNYCRLMYSFRISDVRKKARISNEGEPPPVWAGELSVSKGSNCQLVQDTASPRRGQTGGIDCGSACRDVYPVGSVTLRVTANTGYVADEWRVNGVLRNDCTSSDSCTVDMALPYADRAVSVSCRLDRKVVSVSGPPSHGVVRARDGFLNVPSDTQAGIRCGTGQNNCSEKYSFFEQVDLAATADTNYKLKAWTGDCASANPATGAPPNVCTVTIDGDKTVGATFERNYEAAVLTVSSSAQGKVTSNQQGTEPGANRPMISCGRSVSAGATASITTDDNCDEVYAKNAGVTLTATPLPNYHFVEWAASPAPTPASAICAGAITESSCTLTLARDMTYSARFEADRTPKRVSVSVGSTVVGPAGGTVTGGGIDCDSGKAPSNPACWEDTAADTFGLTANAPPGYTVTWSGGVCSGNGSTCNVPYDRLPTTVSVSFTGLCGNQAINTGEQCDGGANCTATCTCEAGYRSTTPVSRRCELIPTCGNGALNTGEACDGGAHCATNCQCASGFRSTTPKGLSCEAIPTCGNGALNTGEACDGGAHCATNCQCASGFRSTTPKGLSCEAIPTCGNGALNTGEACDGGAHCATNCQCAAGHRSTTPKGLSCEAIPTCGNGALNTGEACDGGAHCATNCQCASGFRSTTPKGLSCEAIPTCGNGALNTGEACDGGAHCATNCQCASGFRSTTPKGLSCEAIPTCGNGALNTGEACDGGAHCATNCQCAAGHRSTTPKGLSCEVIPTCGNGARNAGEQCDGGPHCLANCRCRSGYVPVSATSLDCKPLCGNDIRDPGEQCDGGNNCQVNCQCLPGYEPISSQSFACQPICGNGRADTDEACDGGTSCNAQCQCASGFRSTTPKSRACEAIPTCGNGALNTGEACDGGAHCATNCQCASGFRSTTPKGLSCEAIPTCGNGALNAGEACDGGAHCATNCQCASGFRSTTPKGLSCEAIPTCGNGALNTGEACDGGAHCAANCQCTAGHRSTTPKGLSCEVIPTCGNGTRNTGEQCDGGAHCTNSCQCESGHQPISSTSVGCQAAGQCGNHFKDPGEQCDGVLGCNSNCQCAPGLTPGGTNFNSCDGCPRPGSSASLTKMCGSVTSAYSCCETSDMCQGSSCLPMVCTPQGMLCNSATNCCNGLSCGGPANNRTCGGTSCKVNGVTCGLSSECCSSICANAVCQQSACIPNGQTCHNNSDCCTGRCGGSSPNGGTCF